MTYTLTTLPNGLRVASEHLPGLETVAVAVSVKVGARYEQTEQSGISHLLEHMAFKGTARRNARQIAEAFDDIGGASNAYTSLENTVYYARVLKQNLREAVDILADILQHSQFDETELAREKHVIVQEIAMHYDSPDDLVFDYFHETAWPKQPLGRSILGTPELVQSFTRENLQRYMGTHYHAPSMVVSAAGNIKHEELLALAQEYFGNLPGDPAHPPEQANYTGGDFRKKRKLEQLHIMLGVPCVSNQHADYYASQLVSTILGGGMSSRLFQEVREKRGLAYTVQAFVTAYEDSGIFGIYAATGEDKAEQLVPVLCDELQKLPASLTDAEIIRAKNQLKAGLLMTRESSSSVAEWIGRHLLNYGRYKTAEEITRIIDGVSKDDIARVAATLVNPQVTFTALGPQGKLEDIDSIRTRLKH